MKKVIFACLLLSGILLFSQTKTSKEKITSSIPEKEKKLILELYESDTLLRVHSLQKLFEMRPVSSIPFLIGLLGERGTLMGAKYYEGQEAAKVLANIGKPAMLDVLRALEDPNPLVCADAAYVMIARHLELRLDYDPEITPLEKKAGDALVKMLSSPVDETRINAAKVLGLIKEEKALDPLIAALEDSSPEVQDSIAWALGCYKDQRATQPLLFILKKCKKKYNIIWALGELGDPRAIETLASEIKNIEDVHLAKTIAEALGKIHDPAVVESLISMTKYEFVSKTEQGYYSQQSTYARARAAAALGQYKEARVVSALIEALNDNDDYVRKCAAESLGSIGPEAREAIPAINDALGKKRIPRDVAKEALKKIEGKK